MTIEPLRRSSNQSLGLTRVVSVARRSTRCRIDGSNAPLLPIPTRLNLPFLREPEGLVAARFRAKVVLFMTMAIWIYLLRSRFGALLVWVHLVTGKTSMFRRRVNETQCKIAWGDQREISAGVKLGGSGRCVLRAHLQGYELQTAVGTRRYFHSPDAGISDR